MQNTDPHPAARANKASFRAATAVALSRDTKSGSILFLGRMNQPSK